MNDSTAWESDKLWCEAEVHYENHRHDEAIKAYKYLIQKYSDVTPAVGRANAHLGEIIGTLGWVYRWPQAAHLGENHLKKAISCDPDNPYYHYLLGSLYSALYQWEQAISELAIAVNKEPDNQDYLEELARAAFLHGDKETGIEYLGKAVALKDTVPRIFIGLVEACLGMDDIERAKAYANKLVGILPGDLMTHVLLNKIGSESGKDEGSGKPLALDQARNEPVSGLFFKVYELKVISNGRPEEFVMVKMKGDQSLATLHSILCRTFARSDSSTYMFLFGDTRHDETGRHIVAEHDGNPHDSRDSCTPISECCHRLGQRFLYLVEDCDKLQYEIIITGLRYEIPCQEYPAVVLSHHNLQLLYPAEPSLRMPGLSLLENVFSNN